MTTFWPLAMLLMLFALLFIMVPLLLKPRVRGVRRDALNVQVIRDQLAELQSDLDSGRLDQSSYADARHDLERELLDDVNVGSASADADSGRGRWLILVLLVLVPVTAVSIYQLIGVPDVLQLQAVVTPVAPPSDDAPHSVEEMIESLAARLRQDPGSAEGWSLLGRSYVAVNRYKDAAEAYQRALQLSGDDAELLSSYADVLVLVNDGKFTDEVGEVLDRAVAVDPRHAKARWLRGHWKVRRGDKVGAVEDWKIAQAALPPGSENVLAIQQQINEVQGREAQPAAVAPTEASPADTIKVHVVLDPALVDSASPEDTVFIFARAIQGPRMPLAAVRKRVADLPVTVTLDDSLAMSPAMVLSNFDQVTVGARISKSGQAITASGDLQGSVSPVDVAGSQVKVVIDQLVP